MSTVLWANQLRAGEVKSAESDLPALHKHVDKLDGLAKKAGVIPFSSLLDHTDINFNLDDNAELPEGMTSTNQVMARDGVWKSAEEALACLNGLLKLIETEKPRFGMLKSDYGSVVSELKESIAFAQEGASAGARFNFCVVM